MNAISKRERARQRIREIDAQKAGRQLPLFDGGSLSSPHTASQLASLVDNAFICELDERADGRRCFILQHADEPSARLAQIWLLPPYKSALNEGGRFDLGEAGSAGFGPTLRDAQSHDALPLGVAEPLVTHLIDSIGQGQHLPVEAVAALPGLSSWVTRLTAADMDHACGAVVAAAREAALEMALDGSKILDFPQGIKMRTAARPAWEVLATQYAQTDGAAEEVALYRSAGASHVGIAYLADTSPEGLSESGGAMSMLKWPGTGDPGREKPSDRPSLGARPKCGLGGA